MLLPLTSVFFFLFVFSIFVLRKKKIKYLMSQFILDIAKLDGKTVSLELTSCVKMLLLLEGRVTYWRSWRWQKSDTFCIHLNIFDYQYSVNILYLFGKNTNEMLTRISNNSLYFHNGNITPPILIYSTIIWINCKVIKHFPEL